MRLFTGITMVLLLMAGWLAAQTIKDTTVKKNQAKAPPTQVFGAEAFRVGNTTTLRWLGMAGYFINSRGTTMMIDPLLGGFDMPVMIKFPIAANKVPKLDAVLVTHADNDHYSVPTIRDLRKVTKVFHSTIYVDSLMTIEGLPSHGHPIGGSFQVGAVRVGLTPADHAYQNHYPGMSSRWFKNEDACGFWIETPDGNIWAPGDSRLLPDHLQFPEPDAILFDFSDSEWHFTLEGAIMIANAYPHTPLLLNHWGSVNAPDFAPFNANPKDLYDKVVNPDRIKVLAPGQPFTLERISKKTTNTDSSARMLRSRQTYEKLFRQVQSVSHSDDPELLTILQRFIFGEVFYTGNLPDSTRELITITALVTNQSLPQLTAHTHAALNTGVQSIAIRELVYQLAPVIGYPKVLNALDTINRVFKARGIALPLPNQSTISESQRLEKGKSIQYPLYGDGMKENMKDLPDGFAEAIPGMLSASFFGDFYTRGGLDIKTRELMIFSALVTLGGTERQLLSHARGNIKVGNDQETLLSALVQLYPYIGFPRMANGIYAIREILK